MLVVITLIDHFVRPRVNLSIAYFIPILFAAWTLGRGAAIVTAVISDVETISEQLTFIRLSSYPWYVGAIEMVLQLLVFIYVAELAVRLIKSVSDARRIATELRAANERVNEDIATAGLLQSSVLEFEPPKLPGCEAGACLRMAEPIGGDFVDAGVVDGKVFACVADIAGKGIPAALFTTLLKHLLIDAHNMGLRSADVVTALNAGLSQTLPSERFVTLFYIEIDPITRQATYVNAGHPDGLLLRHNTGEIDILAPTGPILTLFGPEMNFSAQTIQLHMNDVIVLYTDGAIESKVPSGDRLGEEPIRKLAIEYAAHPAQEMAERICDGIEDALDGILGDDLTVLCVRTTALHESMPEPTAGNQGQGIL